MFTFLCATSQAKTLTLDETSDFHQNLARGKGIGSNRLDKVKRKDFIVSLKMIMMKVSFMGQMETSMYKREMVCVFQGSQSQVNKVRMEIKVPRKRKILRLVEIGRFLTMIISKILGCYEHKGWYPHHKSS